MFCKNCGKKLEEGQIFCPDCGTKNEVNVNNTMSQNDNVMASPTMMASQTQPVMTPTDKNKNRNILIVVLVVIGAIIAITVIPIVVFTMNLVKGVNEINDRYDNEEEYDVPIIEKEEEGPYKVGQYVQLVDGSEWHVLSSKGNNAVLLSDTLAVETMGYGNSRSEEDQKYENSNVKKYIDETYAPALKQSLTAAGGNTNINVRILKAEEYLKLTNTTVTSCFLMTPMSINGHAPNERNYDYSKLKGTDYESYDKAYNFLGLTKSFWTMTGVRDTEGCSDFGFYGSFWVEIDTRSLTSGPNDEFTLFFASLNLDSNAIDLEGKTGTFVGIRPVIETNISNIKK